LYGPKGGGLWTVRQKVAAMKGGGVPRENEKASLLPHLDMEREEEEGGQEEEEGEKEREEEKV